jgi:hypothetical protein
MPLSDTFPFARPLGLHNGAVRTLGVQITAKVALLPCDHGKIAMVRAAIFSVMSWGRAYGHEVSDVCLTTLGSCR